MIDKPSFNEFVKLVRRKISNDSRLNDDTKTELLQEVDEILADDFFDEVGKEILFLNMLRRYGIPVGVEGGALRIQRKQRRHLYRR